MIVGYGGATLTPAPSPDAPEPPWDDGRGVLLLEDLAPAQPGDQLLGCDTEVAAAAVAELVKELERK